MHDGLPGQPVPADTGVLSVREVTAYVKRLFDRDELLQGVVVRGEISNFTRAASGHLYFSLKDEACQLSCACFRGAAAKLPFDPKDGDRVVAGGNVTVYERAGRYQLLTKFMRPDGLGALAEALERLKGQLEAEGLFDPSRKRPLPRFPQVIAVCTSPTGAAVRDLTSIIGRRYALAKTIVIPTVVQGDEAGPSIIRSLEIANSLPDVDVIIVGRGGGSIEDLWAFNLEPVARAIFGSGKPVVSAVGHESDFTIADLVADVRAATPSMAAEMVTPETGELLASLESQGRHLRGAMAARIARLRSRLDNLAAHPLLQRPEALLEQRQLRLDDAAESLVGAMSTRLERARVRTERAIVALHALSPVAVVSRGYAICRRSDGSVVRRIGDVATGDTIAVMVSDGDILGDVTGCRALPEVGGQALG